MKRTLLYDAHIAHQAKVAPFAGWEMPLHYSGVIDEYHAVRNRAGLFDVSHMGRISVEGGGAFPFLQKFSTNNLATVEVGSSQYSMVCNPMGGIKDDIFIYRLGEKKYLLCVNASNREKILAWLQELQKGESRSMMVKDLTSEIAQLALQGPGSKAILQMGINGSLDGLKPRKCLEVELFGVPILVTRTGYTGERGYELYVPNDKGVLVWNNLLTLGPDTVKPVGLGARDLLRLDMGYYLYGNELSEETTPVEAGAEWIVDFKKEDFIGKARMMDQRERGTLRRLVGFELLEKAVPRQGMKLFHDESEVGQVTSGNLSPVLQKGIGMGYVLSSHSQIGSGLQVDIRGRRVQAVVVKPPFYHKSKI